MKRASKLKRKTPTRKKHGQDKTMTAVLNAIECIVTVPRDSIKVTVDAGWVRLEGTVNDWSQKETVDNLVRRVPGVRGVLSLLQAQQ